MKESIVSHSTGTRVLRRGDEGYEQARRAVIWHAGAPNRFPEVIVRAHDEDGVMDAVRLARDEDRQMAVCSGHHSWSGSHLRDGTVLLDLAGLRDVSVDSETMTATVQPGVRGSELGALLHERGLFFPVGHCEGVCVGGYLLQGGFGWRGRELGPSCMSVTGIDVVTADGNHTYADGTRNTDLFWAARGAGPGFFGVVTRFHVKLYSLQPVTLTSFYLYPPDVWEEYLRWSRSIEPTLPAEVELWNLMYRDESMSSEGPVISVSATAFVDTEERAREALALFERCPVRDRALIAEVNRATTTSELTARNTHYPPDRRFIADNTWTHASFDELLPGLRAIHQDFPPAPTHLVWFPWTLTPQRPSMAYSVEDELYLALYAGWEHPADDETYRRWVTERMRAMEPLATGIQLADENLINRPRRFVTEDSLRRLDEIRARYDPDGRFVSWLGRPQFAHAP
ncbi:FAD-binding oxidoreductase [Streptomyces inhibens]|uniref:FAD-binding oxidoreductase n=1 Tax=Streptomyces inhibens TaxID=2293571 RepID=UPI003798150B